MLSLKHRHSRRVFLLVLFATTHTVSGRVGVWRSAAQHACASVGGSNYYLCVQDIMEMGDLGMATFWVRQQQQQAPQQDTRRDALVVQARQACAPVQSSWVNNDYNLCIQDVLETQNLGIAELWTKSSLQQQQQQQQNDGVDPQRQLQSQARVACSTVSGSGFDACLEDVMATQNLRLADLWTRAEQEHQRRRRLRGSGNKVEGWTMLW